MTVQIMSPSEALEALLVAEKKVKQLTAERDEARERLTTANRAFWTTTAKLEEVVDVLQHWDNYYPNSEEIFDLLQAAVASTGSSLRERVEKVLATVRQTRVNPAEGGGV